MKNGKATGMDGIPVEVWKYLGEEGIDMLWDMMQGIYECQETAEAGTGEERLHTVDYVFYSRIAKRQPRQTQIQVYSLYYNKAYTPYFTQTNMCNIGHVGGGSRHTTRHN